jgi:predicted unusual protein kinase regulating ubiquinone biosynthesis (AarF/ABC1/UbiB family)
MFGTLLKIPYLRLKYRFLPNDAQKFWAQELLDSQGLSAKLGQVLGQGKVTGLPKSSMPPDEAKKIFQKGFPKTITFSGEVLAASMGQVFFVTIDGQDYALKILHPGIKEKLKKEIDNLLLLGGYFAKTKGFTFDKNLFRRFLVEVFEEETDLKREAHFQEKFCSLFKDDPLVKIPSVVKDFSNGDILCQEKIMANLARDLTSFEHQGIFDFFFRSLLTHGLLHGDLNDRNWGLLDQRVVVYDFGCSQIVSERRITGLKKLILNKDVVEGFKELGVRLEATWFRGREQELRDALFIPLFEKEILPSWSYSEGLQSTFGEKIKLLRDHTDPWVLLMMRSLFSLIRVYQDRGTKIHLKEVIAPYLTLKETSMKATQIKVEVLEHKKQVVFMTLPITALPNMEDLMPEKVLEKIRSENLNIKTMIQSVEASDYAPQELFHLSIGERSYRVWID